MAVGVNVMLTVQLAEPARLVPQVLAEIAKSPGFVPDSATLLIAMALVPPLVRVTVWAAVVAPVVVEAKVRLVGATVEFAANPVPDKVTVWGLFAAASVKVRVAVRDPVAVGLNVMLTVQLAEPARLAPQVLAEMA